jgi:UDP-3-O-[3-hydroxymyristoyl] glucosamine N-acyltransferase
MKITVGQLAERLGAEFVGRPEESRRQISAVGALGTARESDVTFIRDDKYATGLKNCRAGAVIVGRRLEALAKPQLVVKNVDAALIEALSFFAPELKGPVEGIDPSAKIGQDVKIAEGTAIGACAVVEAGVEIGQNSVIGSGCKIGENSRVGKNCRLDSNVVVYHNCHVGDNVIIQANSTIGSTGFGYVFIDGAHRLIPHNGRVVIEDFVEIGANCCIDRAKFGDTVVGAGTKIDNLVQIAHNVVIGKCCLIAGHVGIAGSCKLGDGVVLGGQVGLTDNIEVGDGTMVGGQSGVTRCIPAGRRVAGRPAIEVKEALRISGLTMRLPKLAAHLKEVTKRVERLESAKDYKE